MWPFDPPADRAPSALWLWGFWTYAGAAVAAFVLSLYAPTPVDRLFRGIAGALLLVGARAGAASLVEPAVRAPARAAQLVR